jgi:outer membrane lipoprotein-sorting protein
MRSAFVRLVVMAGLVLAAVAPGDGAPAGGAVWNGDSQAVREYQEAYAAYAALTSYKSRVSGTGPNGPFEMTMEWVKPNRLRMSFAAPAPGAFITIGEQQWSTSSQGCTRIPPNVRMPGPQVDTPDKALDGTVTVARAGTATIDGVTTNVYDVVTVTTRGGTTTRSKTKAYVNPSNKMFKRWEVETEQGKVNIDYLEFNSGIRIDPPC